MKNAVILAAGYGMRMVPINTEVPKALLQVRGETLIERLIHQLMEAGIEKIYIVAGFMKEKFEYLTELYPVTLINNEEYAVKNNLHSLKLAAEYLSDSYIIPCDIWCTENPFLKEENDAWYMVSRLITNEAPVKVTESGEILAVEKGGIGNKMIGVCSLTKAQSDILRDRLNEWDSNPEYDTAFWEDAMYDGNKMIVPAKVVRPKDVVEINTYEQLRELDQDSKHLRTEAISVAADALDTEPEEIVNIQILKKGMTNRSFLFECRGSKYIMRIPGEGTEQLVNRAEEAEVYQTIFDKHICDDIIYINPENGYKITGYLEGARCCDPLNEEDLVRCMAKLKSFHQMELTVDHEFDIFGMTDFYEELWEGKPSMYSDYEETKKNVYSLKKYIDSHVTKKILTHIDAVPDNFLFVPSKDNENEEEVRLIDWEYAGMQDPHVDLAMFCIYALYDREQTDHLIDIYFEGRCPDEVRIKIYCYIAACGLLWSNWCEYKSHLGVEFGEYSLRQYQYAKEYFEIVKANGGIENGN